MAFISNDLINKLSSLQAQIWQTVSLTVTEAVGAEITFGAPLTVGARTSDISADFTAPVLTIQFALASDPECVQVILIPQDTVLSLAAIAKGGEIEAVDENLISEIRGPLESIVQGLCLSIGNVKGEPVLTTGLTFRFQVFSLPQRLQLQDEVLRTQIAVSGNNLNGSATWILDREAAAHIVGMDPNELEDDRVIFANFEEAGSAPTAEEAKGLDLLRDIPLEISVELGRVRMLVKEVVELGTGSVVEIDKAAGEPVDVLVNGRVVARGEVVVIEDNFGVRITEILNPQERLLRLSEVA
jgi:flagellar motor switch protein FliN/FliY